MRILNIALIFLLIISCERLENELPEGVKKSIDHEMLTGSWSDLVWSDSIQIMNRVSSLPNDKYGLLLNEDGTVIENKIAGWCATPPVSYAKYEGTWDLKTDSVFILETDYWGGRIYSEWKIIEFSERKISMYNLYTENRHFE